MPERISLPRSLDGDMFLDDGIDTLALLNNAYWLLRDIEGTWRSNGPLMLRAIEKVDPLLDELGKQRWPDE